MPLTVESGSGYSQEPGTPYRSATVRARTQVLVPSPAASQDLQEQEALPESELSELESGTPMEWGHLK